MPTAEVTLGCFTRMTRQKQNIEFVCLVCAAFFTGCDDGNSGGGGVNTSKPTMTNAYTPPVMPPFPNDYEAVTKALGAYYHDGRSLDFFFEMYIADVIEELPEATRLAMTEFSSKHPTLFTAHGGDWKAYVIGQLHLSDTIETAIWDLWIRNSEIATRDARVYHPWRYAQDFADNFFDKESRVDVWEGNALQLAQDRIEAHRKKRRESNAGPPPNEQSQ